MANLHSCGYLVDVVAFIQNPSVTADSEAFELHASSEIAAIDNVLDIMLACCFHSSFGLGSSGELIN